MVIDSDMHGSAPFKVGFSLAMLLLGVISSLWAYSYGHDPDSPATFIYWGLLPGLPFVILGLLVLVSPSPNRKAYLGAMIGGILACFPYALLYIDNLNYDGGGANIGLGILLLGCAVYFPVFMRVGAAIGRKLS